MKKSNIEYYKEVVKRAENARNTINQANADFERDCVLTKNAYEADLYGERGYKQRLEELEAERDLRIESGLSRILAVVDEYDAEMQRLGELDGNKIDDGTMKLLNSGMSLSSADWQQLADKHADNAIMSKILKERYGENKPKEEKPIVVHFGQSPESRSEVFSKFTRTIYNAARLGACPSLSGGGRLKTVRDYYNYLAQSSLEDMCPFEGEDFSNLDADFPVETVSGKIENAGGRSTSFSPGDPADFNFNFTPVRKA